MVKLCANFIMILDTSIFQCQVRKGFIEGSLVDVNYVATDAKYLTGEPVMVYCMVIFNGRIIYTDSIHTNLILRHLHMHANMFKDVFRKTMGPVF
jgi:hypothetical protein